MRRLRLLPVLPLMLFLLLLAVQAHAGRVSLRPGLGIEYEYNDNIFLTAEEADEEKTEDHIFTLRPGAYIHYDSFRTNARIGGLAAFQRYYENEEENRLPNFMQADAGLARWFSPQTRVEFSDSLTFFYDPRDTFGTEAQEVLSVRTASIGNVAQLLVAQSFSRVSTLEVSYGFSTTEFEAPELFDVVSHRGEIAWRRRVSQRHLVVVFGRYTRNLYNHEFDFIRRLWDEDARMDEDFPTRLKRDSDFDTIVPGLGIEYQITPTLSVSARSGMILPARYLEDTYKTDPIDWYQDLAGTKIFRRYRLSLGYTRDMIPANGIESAVLDQRYNAEFLQIWTRRFETGQDASFSRADQETGRVDAYRTSVLARFLFFPWLGLSVGYQHLEQFTDFGPDASLTTKTNRALVTLSIGPPHPNWLSFTP